MNIIKEFTYGGKFRGLLVDEIKNPAKIILGKLLQLPHPTHEDDIPAECHVLIEWRDEFLSRHKLKEYDAIFRNLFNFCIITWAHNEAWRQMAKWVIKKIHDDYHRLEPLPPYQPDITIWKQDWEIEQEKGCK